MVGHCVPHIGKKRLPSSIDTMVTSCFKGAKMYMILEWR